MSPMEANVDPLLTGSRLGADHPENGVLIPCLFTAFNSNLYAEDQNPGPMCKSDESEIHRLLGHFFSNVVIAQHTVKRIDAVYLAHALEERERLRTAKETPMSLRADLEDLCSEGYSAVRYILDGTSVTSYAERGKRSKKRGGKDLNAVARDLGRFLGLGFPLSGAREQLSGTVTLDGRSFELEVTPMRGQEDRDALEVFILFRDIKLPPGPGQTVEWAL